MPTPPWSPPILLLALGLGALAGGCDRDYIGGACTISHNVGVLDQVGTDDRTCAHGTCLEPGNGVHGALCSKPCQSDSDCDNVTKKSPCAGSFVCLPVIVDVKGPLCCRLCACSDDLPPDGTKTAETLCKQLAPGCP